MYKKFTLALLVPVVLSSMVACNSAPHRADHPYSVHSHYSHPFNQDDYFYYPNSDVYFHMYSGNYYYRNDNQWIRSRHLPKQTYLDQRVRRQLVIKETEPYHHHREHRQEDRHDAKPPEGKKKGARLKQERQDRLPDKQSRESGTKRREQLPDKQRKWARNEERSRERMVLK